MRIHIRHHTIHFGYRHLMGVVHEKRMKLRREADLAKKREIPKNMFPRPTNKNLLFGFTPGANKKDSGRQ